MGPNALSQITPPSSSAASPSPTLPSTSSFPFSIPGFRQVFPAPHKASLQMPRLGSSLLPSLSSSSISTTRLPLHGCLPTRLSSTSAPITSLPFKTPTILPAADSRSASETEAAVLPPTKEAISEVFPSGFSRSVLLGAASVGFMLLLSELFEHRALALGPEGPLMEEFWENVRRYGLYILTVSTGAIYTILQPILELLRNPVSAVLVLVIFAGGFFLVSQVLNAMIGVTEFAYDYAY